MRAWLWWRLGACGFWQAGDKIIRQTAAAGRLFELGTRVMIFFLTIRPKQPRREEQQADCVAHSPSAAFLLLFSLSRTHTLLWTTSAALLWIICRGASLASSSVGGRRERWRDALFPSSSFFYGLICALPVVRCPVGRSAKCAPSVPESKRPGRSGDFLTRKTSGRGHWPLWRGEKDSADAKPNLSLTVKIIFG